MKMKDFLTKMAASHIACAKGHEACASAHSVMHEDSQKIAGGTYHDDLSQSHSAIKEAHTDMVEHCIKMAKALGSAGGNADDPEVEQVGNRGRGGDLDGQTKAAVSGNPWGDQLEPTRISAVGTLSKSNPNRAIPRPGMPDIDTTGIDPKFEKLFQV
jgi:hypothetical protein